MPFRQATRQLKHYHRYAGYDYSRGASLFISLSTDPRRRVFGDVVDGEMALNDLGREVDRALSETEGAQLVKVLPCAMYHDYQPGVEWLPAIKARRLAIIARGNSPGEFSRGACLDLNAAIIPIAKRNGRALWWQSDGRFTWL